MSRAETTINPASDDGVRAGMESGLSPAKGNAAAQDDATGKRGKRKKRFGLRIVFIAFLTVLIAAITGQFVLFAHQIATVTVPPGARADAIVVLTGGQARINEAVRLLEEGRADRLLISGVHPGTTRKQLAAVTASSMPLEEGSVDLDRVALNTAGNAAETASWVRKNGFASLLVVTSAYHLPRAKAELSDVLPDVDLIAYPVFSKDLKLGTWYREPATIRLLMREYVKYILARLRNTVKAVN